MINQMIPLFKMQQEQTNIFTKLLELLKVKHTRKFSEKYYQENPNKYNLYGISKMLSDYHVDNAGIRVEKNPESLLEFEAPYVAHIGSDFVIIVKTTKEKVNYLWKGKTISLPIKEFINLWSGIVFVAEADEKSTEPNYRNNRKDEIADSLKIKLLLITLITIFFLMFWVNNLFDNLGIMISLAINIAGVGVCWLLLSKHLHINSSYADKMCSLLLHKGDCNHILESDASTFLGIFNWSEIGLGYFISNIIIILFLPDLYFYLTIVNICTLPFTLWSVWYQKKIANNWCSLCLIVQILLWLLFMNNMLFNLTLPSIFHLAYFLLVLCLYIIPCLSIHLISRWFIDKTKFEQILYEINSLKATNEVFDGLLRKETHYEIDRTVSNILLGDRNAKNLVTIITNPYCNPCADMHKRIEEFIIKYSSKCCIQFVFISFNDELNKSCKFFINAYLNQSSESFIKLLNYWFKNGRNEGDIFINKHQSNTESIVVKNEFEKHKKWLTTNKINITPSILFNGFKLPENYKLEDLQYFL